MEEMSLNYPPLDTWMTITTYSHMVAMGLRQWNKVHKHSQDELHGPPVVALNHTGSLTLVAVTHFTNFHWSYNLE